AEQSGLPYAAFVHTLYASQAVQPFSPMLMGADAARVNALRAALGLPPVDRVTDLLDRATRVLVTTVPELDQPDGPVAANVRYVGPIVEEPGSDRGWAPPRPADGSPLAVVSLGTTPM